MLAVRKHDLASFGPPDFEVVVDGHKAPAFEGESVLSVLFALDQRGIYPNDHGKTLGAYCSMGVCFSCLVEIDGRAKRRACQTLVRPGMKVRTAAIESPGNDLLPKNSQPKKSPTKSRRVIVGAGPAGLNAALELARHNVASLVIDENPDLGGAIFRQSTRRVAPHPFAADKTYRRAQELFAKVEEHRSHIDFLFNAQVVATFDEGRELAYLKEGELHRLPHEQLFLCTGCYERAQPFPGWDLPGVMSVGGAQLQAKRGLVRPAQKMALVGTGPLLLVAALQLHRAGVEVVGVFEAGRRSDLARQWPRLLSHPSLLLEGMRYMVGLLKAGVPIHYGWGIVEARGRGALEEVTVAPYDSNWRVERQRRQELQVDGLGVGYGYTSRNQLSQLLGCRQAYDGDTGGIRPAVDEWLRTSRQGVWAAGDGVGVYGSETAEIEGRLAALGALLDDGRLSEDRAAKAALPLRRKLDRLHRFRSAIDRFSSLRPGLLDLPAQETVICRCENVSLEKIAQAVGSGVGTFPALKMATRVGMGDCQGKMCGRFACEYLMQQTGSDSATVGHPRPRIPLAPVPFPALVNIQGEK